MNYIFKILFTALLFSTLVSCSVEGDEILGIWYTNGQLGKMKIEIKPLNGTFVGYLLEYEKNGKLIQGGTEEKDLIFKGLEFINDKYLGGLFLQSPQGNTPCGFMLSFQSEKKLQLDVAYNCNNVRRFEFYNRTAYPDKPYIESNVNTIDLNQLLKANPNNKN